MKQAQMSAGKRLTKPIFFGTLVVGLIAVFYNSKSLFFGDLEELRAKERARNDAKLQEVLERRQKQFEYLEKKGGG